LWITLFLQRWFLNIRKTSRQYSSITSARRAARMRSPGARPYARVYWHGDSASCHNKVLRRTADTCADAPIALRFSRTQRTREFPAV